MKWGIRKPSLKKRIAARTSFSRFVRHSLGFKAPRGFGWFTNPRRAAYNRIYNRTTVRADNVIVLVLVLLVAALAWIVRGLAGLFTDTGNKTATVAGATHVCPRCNAVMVLRNGRRGQFYGCSRFPRCRGTRPFVA